MLSAGRYLDGYVRSCLRLFLQPLMPYFARMPNRPEVTVVISDSITLRRFFAFSGAPKLTPGTKLLQTGPITSRERTPVTEAPWLTVVHP
jgi:hypothetical protein